MEILAIINKILDLKIVQWALLAAVAVMLVGNIWFTIKYNGLRLDNALSKATVADLSSAIHIQNTEILKGAQAFKDQQLIMDGAVKNAENIAKANREMLKSIKDIKLEGTCDEKVKQTLSIINSGN